MLFYKLIKFSTQLVSGLTRKKKDLACLSKTSTYLVIAS
jgi:hypothetical protein